MFKVKNIDETLKLLEKNLSNYKLEEIELKSKNALGYVLSGDIYSKEDVPHFNRSTVDGYAVKHKVTALASSTIPVVLNKVGEVLMGEASKYSINDEDTIYVPTGGHLPDGADSVVMVENTDELGDEIIIYSSTSKWENVLLKASDIKSGDLVLEKGTKIEPRHIGVLTALGIDKINCYRKLKCLVISTGDEIVLPNETPKIGEIRDINTYTVSTHLESLGLEVTDTLIIRDDFIKYKESIIEGFKNNDIVFTSGGSSVGTKDYTIKVMNDIKSDVLVHGISIKPGKPTIMAMYEGKLFFGLPGQPLSAYVVLNTFINDIVKDIYKLKSQPKPYNEAELTMNVHSSPGRRTYQIVNLEDGLATPLFTKSGMISALSKANGYIVIDELSEGLEKGSIVKVYRMGD